MTRLYVPTIYRLQQKILYLSWDHYAGRNGGSDAPTVNELMTITKKTEGYVLRAVKSLEEKGLIAYQTQTHKVYCTPKGEIILRKEDILEDGWEKFKVNLLRWMQIAGIITASSIAIATFILTYTTTNSNKVEIGKLQKEIELLKRKPINAQHLPVRLVPHQPYQDSLRKK